MRSGRRASDCLYRQALKFTCVSDVQRQADLAADFFETGVIFFFDFLDRR